MDTGCVNDQGSHRMLEIGVIRDVLNFLTTVGMVEKKDSWQEVTASGGGPDLGG